MISTAPPAKRLRRHHRKLKRWNMSKNDVLSKFPVHRLEGALRFSAHEVRVGNRAPDFACRISAAKQSGFLVMAKGELKVRQPRKVRHHRHSRLHHRLHTCHRLSPTSLTSWPRLGSILSSVASG